MLPPDGCDSIKGNDLPAIVTEMLQSATSERQGRIIDKDNGASMEDKKQAGYF